MRSCVALFELLLLAASVGCRQPQPGERTRKAPSATSAHAASLASELLPRPASRFFAQNGKLRQEHPRLPDTGEWRCAERDRVVWCAGGESAAGVVSGPPARGYRCGARWGKGNAERVCIDHHPDYPGPDYACSFQQEHGMARECAPAAAGSSPALAAQALPACWLDRDCPAGRCDRGACACNASSDCHDGRCDNGVCIKVKP